MKSTDHENIINRFRSKEVEEIYKKYINVTEQEIAAIIKLIERIEVNSIDLLDIYRNYETTRKIALDIENESDIDLIKLYILLSVNFESNIDIEKTKDHYEQLKDKGYAKIDEYIFYYDYVESELEAIAEESLTEDLENVEKIMELFDKEEIANMWIDKTSLTSAANYYIQDNAVFIHALQRLLEKVKGKFEELLVS